jgi:peptidoglycan/xylan/chitin deacetylase (PgdA/CDA1 family)
MSQPFHRAILTYHSLNSSGSVIALPPETFRSQMRSLFDRGIEVVPLETLATAGDRQFDGPAAALTFDDGFDDFYEEAFPVLSQYRFPALVFLVTGYCGRTNDWPGQPQSAGGRTLLNWSRIAELHRAGIRFGAHTVTHPRLPVLPWKQAASEVLDSKKQIEDRTGVAVTTFAYPYGDESPRLRALIAENFTAGCSTRLGQLRRDSPPESLERIDTYYLSNPFWYRHLFHRRTSGYLMVRAQLRQWKNRLLPHR